MQTACSCKSCCTLAGLLHMQRRPTLAWTHHSSLKHSAPAAATSPQGPVDLLSSASMRLYTSICLRRMPSTGPINLSNASLGICKHCTVDQK